MAEFNLPIYSLPITFAILSMVMVLRYFSLVGLAYWLTKRMNRLHQDKWLIDKSTAPRAQMGRDILWSVLSSFIFAFSGALIIKGWQRGLIQIYLDPGEFGWIYFFLSAPLLFFLHDSYFYWTHRLLHKPLLFKSIHLVHHESRVPSAWTAFSFHPWEALIQALILPILLIIFPVHWGVLLFFLGSMTVLGIINHLGSEFYPSFLRTRSPFHYLISASHHQLHHRKFMNNFGLYFTFWDLWMKTEAEEGHAVR